MPRKGNRCTTMVNFQLTPLEATALQAVVVHLAGQCPQIFHNCAVDGCV